MTARTPATDRSLREITGHSRIDGVVPGVRGQRAFPTRERAIVDPFVMLDHIGPERLPDGFFVDGAMHPHRGFETVTMMFEGVMYHVDSTGFRETLPTGSTQNMRAGRGIQHGGDMAADPDTNVFHEVQLWVNTPAAHKMEAPSIGSARADDKPVLDFEGHRVELIAGTFEGHSSPLATTQPTTILSVVAERGGEIEIPVPDRSWNVVVYALRGGADIPTGSGSSQITEFEMATFDGDGDRIRLRTAPGAHLLVLAGEPTAEPIAMGGPFVMSTRRELAEAEADFRAGLF